MNLLDRPEPLHGFDSPDRVRRVLETCFGSLSDDAFGELLDVSRVVDLPGGALLFAEGDSADALYVLLAGRLRALAVAADGSMRLLGEIEPGAPVGEMAVITGGVRSASIVAVRDSSLLRIDAARMQSFFDSHPRILLGTARQVVMRVARNERRRRERQAIVNIAVIPVTPEFDASRFASDLCQGLGQAGSVLCLNVERVRQLSALPLASNGALAEAAQQRSLTHWLNGCELEHDFVVYCADARNTPWTQRCLRQADRVVLVADAAAAPAPGPLERDLSDELEAHMGPRNLLVLSHAPATVRPQGTAHWLACRPWVSEVIHMRRGDAAHAGRVARLASGRANGLVLGSGGARGIVHFGIYRALEEAGAPIDRIGGSSIGAIIGAGMATDVRAADLIEVARRGMSSSPVGWRDLAIPPIRSLYRGDHMRRNLVGFFAPGTAIEDLWINFFCISSDLTRARETVHTCGDLERAIMASSAIPGLFPLVTIDGARHADGAFMNALPADVMARQGVHRIHAVDLSSDLLAPLPPRPRRGVGGLRRRMRDALGAVTEDPRADPGARDAPGIGESLVQSSLIASSARLAELRRQVDVLFNPDVRGFRLMRWSPRIFDALCRLGTEHGHAVLAQQAEEESEILGMPSGAGQGVTPPG